MAEQHIEYKHAVVHVNAKKHYIGENEMNEMPESYKSLHKIL